MAQGQKNSLSDIEKGRLLVRLSQVAKENKGQPSQMFAKMMAELTRIKNKGGV